MRIWEKLFTWAGGMLYGIRNPFGRKSRTTSAEVREEIYHRLAPGIAMEQDRKVFSFRKIAIRLQPPTKRIAREFETEFMENSSLKSDISGMLARDRVEAPKGLEISVELRQRSLPAGKNNNTASLFEMQLQDRIAPPGADIPEIRMEILKGKGEQAVYRVVKESLLIGCMPEVQDREGRLVRRNNIVFPHDGNDWFDLKMREFRIMDESSRAGTRIVREGQTIEVPAENVRGVGLRSGDEIYFGQACLRFTLAKNSG
jgi:hypothetical protein